MRLGLCTINVVVGSLLLASPPVASFVRSPGLICAWHRVESISLRPSFPAAKPNTDVELIEVDRRAVLLQQFPLAVLLAIARPARASTVLNEKAAAAAQAAKDAQAAAAAAKSVGNNAAAVEEVAVWGTSTDQPSAAASILTPGKINPNVTLPEVTDRCFLDLSVDSKPAARITVALFGKVAPRTAANFVSLCLGTGPGGASYKGTSVYRVVKDLNVGFGDVGGGGDNCIRSNTCVSGSGPPIPVENYAILHTLPGLVSMARGGEKGTFDSRFFVQLSADAKWADDRYTAFGLLDQTDGSMEVVRNLTDLKLTRQNNPLQKVVITDCGILQ